MKRFTWADLAGTAYVGELLGFVAVDINIKAMMLTHDGIVHAVDYSALRQKVS